MSHCYHVGKLCNDTTSLELSPASIANQVRGASMASHVRSSGAVVFFRDATKLDENLIFFGQPHLLGAG